MAARPATLSILGIQPGRQPQVRLGLVPLARDLEEQAGGDLPGKGQRWASRGAEGRKVALGVREIVPADWQ
jgi:hypothetical protein